MSDTSAPLEEGIDDEMPQPEHRCDERPPFSNDDQPPTHSLPLASVSSSMECMASFTDPTRDYFFPTAPRKPRSKSANHIQRPPLPAMRSQTESVESPGGPPPSEQVSGELEEENMQTVREKQQAVSQLAAQAKCGSQHRRQSLQQEMFGVQSGRDGERSAVTTKEKFVIYDSKMEHLLRPIQKELNRLKITKIPPYSPRLNVKPAAQVLRERLLPVGKHILALLQKEREEKRGELELEIWYIADTYWPSEILEADYLRIMEIYRNAVFYEEVEAGRGVGEWELKGG